MSSDFNIDYGEVASLQNSYGHYKEKIGGEGGKESGVLCQVDSACMRLYEFDAFTGAAADSIKSYFKETHGYLSYAISSLVGQLATDYAESFCHKFIESPISETHSDAHWPASEMDKAALDIIKFRTDDMNNANNLLQQAAQMLPSGSSYAVSFPTALSDAIYYEFRKTSEIRTGVESADAAGKAAFTNDEGEFIALADALSAAIAACASISNRATGGYSEGSFSAILDSTGLSLAVHNSQEDQARKRDIVIESYKESIHVERENNERAAKEALEKKRTAAWFGIAGTALIIVGAVVTVATAGAASPVVMLLAAAASSYTVGKSLVDAKDRVDQISELYWGDPLADKKDRDTAAGDTVVGAVKFSKSATKMVEHGASVNVKGMSDDIIGAGDGIVDEIGDEAVDFIKRKSGLDDTAGGAYTDAAWTVTKEVKSQLLDGSFSAGGTLSATGKAISAVSDYYVEEADEKLEALHERANDLDSVETGLERGHVWGCVETSFANS